MPGAISSPSLTPGAVSLDLGALLRAAQEATATLGTRTRQAYARVWGRLLAWSGVHGLDPRSLSMEQARAAWYAVAGVHPSTQRQASAALACAYRHWERPDPFASLRPPKAALPPPRMTVLDARDLARLLAHLEARQGAYGASLVCHLAAALVHTGARFAELAGLRWADCVDDHHAGRVVGLRLSGGPPVPVSVPLAESLGVWRELQAQHRGQRVLAARGLAFCRSEFVFAGPGGRPFTNAGFNAHLRRAAQALGLPVAPTAQGLRRSVAVILLRDQGHSVARVQAHLRLRERRTAARYVACGQDDPRASSRAGVVFRGQEPA